MPGLWACADVLVSEYPFALADALAYKFGCRDPDPGTALAQYAAEARGARGHMGNPGAEDILYEWPDKAIDGKP